MTDHVPDLTGHVEALLPDFAVRHADDGPSGHDGTPPDQLP